MAVVRYLVDDVEAASAFYTDKLGFRLERSMGPAFAIVSRGDLSLWLSGPQSSGARPMPDGRQPRRALRARIATKSGHNPQSGVGQLLRSLEPSKAEDVRRLRRLDARRAGAKGSSPTLPWPLLDSALRSDCFRRPLGGTARAAMRQENKSGASSGTTTRR